MTKTLMSFNYGTTADGTTQQKSNQFKLFRHEKM